MIKRNSDEQEWRDAIQSPVVSKEQVDQLLQETIDEIKRLLGNKKVAVAYSGGKDANVLLEVMKQSGVSFEVFNVITKIEYPEFIQWLKDKNIPNYHEVVIPIDWNWVKNNEHMIFPRDSKLSGRWYQIVQHKGQKQFAKDNEVEILVLGRRKSDGNYVGAKGKNHYKKKTEDFHRYSPLADWSHDEVLAFIHYYNIDLPPIYDYPNGFKNGTHPIAARPNTTDDTQALQELNQIDKGIVKDMANHDIQIAKDFLQKGGK